MVQLLAHLTQGLPIFCRFFADCLPIVCRLFADCLSIVRLFLEPFALTVILLAWIFVGQIGWGTVGYVLCDFIGRVIWLGRSG